MIKQTHGKINVIHDTQNFRDSKITLSSGKILPVLDIEILGDVLRVVVEPSGYSVQAIPARTAYEIPETVIFEPWAPQYGHLSLKLHPMLLAENELHDDEGNRIPMLKFSLESFNYPGGIVPLELLLPEESFTYKQI